jgi:hypothetical protein
MFKKGLIATIGKPNYIHYVTFVTNLYQSAYVPFKAPGTEIIKHSLIPRGGTVVHIGANATHFPLYFANAFANCRSLSLVMFFCMGDHTYSHLKTSG